MSNRKIKSNLVNKMYGKIASLGGRNFKIDRDDLRHKYSQIHAHTIYISTNLSVDSLASFRERVVADLLIEGWNMENPSFATSSKVMEWLVSYRDGKCIYMFVSKVSGQSHSARFEVFPVVMV